MAKVALSKLGLKVDNSVKEVEFNGQIIEVKQYLPMDSQLQLLANVVNQSQDENNFQNDLKADGFLILEIVKTLTNISFTDKQLEDEAKLYDMIVSSGLWEVVKAGLADGFYDNMVYYLRSISQHVYTYRTSVYAVLDALKKDYNGLNFDIDNMAKQIQNGENVEFLKDVLTKLG